MTLRFIYIDLNSYFASVEQAENPALMGLPVAVVPMMAETTCCLAASYPAKACGVRTGTLVRDARRLCPKIQFIEADHNKYVEYHHRIIEAVEKSLPVWKVFSIDEMAVKLFGREQSREFAQKKAVEIKHRISEVHPALTCSVGIAPNRYIAKIASDMQKPNGLVTIESHELPERLHSLTLRDFPGIGPRMEKRLIEARCLTAQMLCQKSSAEMYELWGSKVGEDFWKLIHGEEVEEVETERGSISHSRVLAPQQRSQEYARAHLIALVSKAGMRLRHEEFYTRSLSLHLTFLHSGMGTNHWEEKAKFFETQDTGILIDTLLSLWNQAPLSRGIIYKIGIVLGSLVPKQSHQLSLWESDKQNKLMTALDSLNSHYRKNLIVYGASSELEKSHHAPIAFGHIPEKFERS